MGSAAAVVLMTMSASLKAPSSASKAMTRPSPPPAAVRREVAIGDEDRAGAQHPEVLEGQFPHLAGADDQDGLIVEVVEDVTSDVDGDTRDRELAAAQPRLVAGPLGGAQGPLEDGMEDRPDDPPAGGGLVGIADLTEDLVLAGHQALQADRDAEEMADRRLLAVEDRMPGHTLGRHPVERSPEGRQLVDFRRCRLGGRVDLNPVAGREQDELGVRETCLQRAEPPAVTLSREGQVSRTEVGAER